jgi:ABC-2 type transport system permease protein
MTASVLAPSLPGRWRTAAHTFVSLLARDLRVMRRQAGALLVRAIMQPLFFTFIFTYVMPKIGLLGAPGASTRSFNTVLVPGLVAVTIAIQGIMAVTMPLLLEFSYNKEIEDRAMAPVPLWLIGVQKIVAGALQAYAAGALVFPIVLLVHEKGQAPFVHIYNWSLFLTVYALSGLLGAASGLLLGTVVDIRKAQQFFAVVVTPLTMLGCVYYPWATLAHLRWMQYVTLLNPVVYMSEGLRAALTPQVSHMPDWAFLTALAGGTVVMSAIGLRTFLARVVD